MLVFMAGQRGQVRPLSHTLTAHGLTGTASARQVECWATGNERKRDLRNIRWNSRNLRGRGSITNSFFTESTLGILNLLVVEVRNEFPVLVTSILPCLTTTRDVFVDGMERGKLRFLFMPELSFKNQDCLPPFFLSCLPHLSIFPWSLTSSMHLTKEKSQAV